MQKRLFGKKKSHKGSVDKVSVDEARMRGHLDLQTEMNNFRTHLLANAIINGLIPSRWNDARWAVAAVTVLLALSLFVVSTLISKIVDGALPVLGYNFLASALTVFCFAIIKVLHDGIFPRKVTTFPERLPQIAKEKTKESIAKWFNSYLKIWKQLVVSILFGVAGIGTLLAFKQNAGSDFRFGSYVVVFLCFFASGNGAYCSIGIPTLIRRISKCEMEMFWLSPADTPWIREASWIFIKLALADAFVFAWGIVGLYLLKPLNYGATTLVALIWLFIGLSTILYTFLFPHHYLTKTIRAEKRRQIQSLQKLIIQYQASINSVKPAGPVNKANLANKEDIANREDIEKLAHLVTIYERLAAARESAVDLKTWIGLIPTLALPSVPYLSLFGRSLIEIGKRYGVI